MTVRLYFYRIVLLIIGLFSIKRKIVRFCVGNP